jgi:uncharacterized protein (DUF1330 family)
MAEITIRDTERYNTYLEGFDEVFKKYAGEAVAVDDHPTILKGSWTYSRCTPI